MKLMSLVVLSLCFSTAVYAAPPSEQSIANMPCIGKNEAEIPSVATQKWLLVSAVSATEKQKVTGVDLISGGLAVVHYGKGKAVRVVYTFKCNAGADPEMQMANPMGFFITGYVPFNNK